MYLHEKDNSCVGHGVGEPQDATAHNGIAEVEGGHSKGSSASVLLGARTENGNWFAFYWA